MTWEAVGLGPRTWRCSTFLQQATIGPFRSSLEPLLAPPTAPRSQTSMGGASRLNKEVNLASRSAAGIKAVQSRGHRSISCRVRGQKTGQRCQASPVEPRVPSQCSVRQQRQTAVSSSIKARSVLVGWNLSHDCWMFAHRHKHHQQTGSTT